MAIEKGNTDAMVGMGKRYIHRHTGDEMIVCKYYMSAVEKGNQNAMIALGDYYNIYEHSFMM